MAIGAERSRLVRSRSHRSRVPGRSRGVTIGDRNERRGPGGGQISPGPFSQGGLDDAAGMPSASTRESVTPATHGTSSGGSWGAANCLQREAPATP
jgi:hypothetical protein